MVRLLLSDFDVIEILEVGIFHRAEAGFGRLQRLVDDLGELVPLDHHRFGGAAADVELDLVQRL